MPLYAYRCLNCGVNTERRERLGTEMVVLNCEHCGEITAAPRVFIVCRNIVTRGEEWQGVNQRELLPTKEDVAAWEARTNGNWRHAPRRHTDGLAEALLEDRRAGFDA